MILREASLADANSDASPHITNRQRDVAFAPMAASSGDVPPWVKQSLIPAGRAFATTRDAVIVALRAISVQERVGWIDQLYVAPGRGHGRAQIDLAKAKLPSPSYLDSFQENHGARRFYGREGLIPLRFPDGSNNEERCPVILFRCRVSPTVHANAGPIPCLV